MLGQAPGITDGKGEVVGLEEFSGPFRVGIGSQRNVARIEEVEAEAEYAGDTLDDADGVAGDGNDQPH